MLSKLPYIFYELGKNIENGYRRLRHKWFIGVVLFLIVGSLVVAVNSQSDSVIQQTAIGAFSGLLIGFILLLYEQFREEEREDRQIERDISQVKRLQKAEDIQKLADMILHQLKPAFKDIFFNWGLKNERTGFNILEVNLEKLEETELEKYLGISATLVKRLNNSELSSNWNLVHSKLQDVLYEAKGAGIASLGLGEEYSGSVQIDVRYNPQDIEDSLQSIESRVEELRSKMELS